jgi:hypothetical protein
LGLVACGFAFAPLFQPGSRGYVLSTVGVTAVISGVAALRISRRTVTRALAVVGIVLGVVGSVGMVTRAATLWAPAWAASAAPPAPTAPVAPARTTASQAATTVVALIERSHRAGDAYPSVLAADPAGWIVTLSGSYRMPSGDVFSYIPSSDLSGYRLQIADPNGVVARYDSVTRTITAG